MFFKDFITQRNRAYLEGLLSFIIILILIMVFFKQIISSSVAVERESMQQTISHIRTGLRIFSFKKIIQSRGAELISFENTNPINVLTSLPANYSGEYSGRHTKSVPKGQWYFDKTSKELKYRVIQSDYLFDKGKNVFEARYRVKYLYQDNDNNNVYNPNVDKAKMLSLEPQGDYNWQ